MPIPLVNKVMSKSMYPMLVAEHRVHADGTLSLVTGLRDGFRPCANFFRVNQASQAAIPNFIGLPRSTVHAEWHPRGARYRIHPPASRTLLSRTRRSLEDTWVSALAEEFRREKRRLAEAYDRLWATALELAKQGSELSRAREDRERLTRELEASAERDLDVARRAADLSEELGLTKRQGEVLACLLSGASNKEIAESLGCSPRTVEVHVSNILQLTGLDGRTSLIAYAFSGLLSSRR